MKFCCTFKRAIKILWNLAARFSIDLKVAWLCVSTNGMRGWRTKQELLDPSVGQKCCTRTLKTEQHLCLWKVYYHYPANSNRMIKKGRNLVYLVKMSPDFWREWKNAGSTVKMFESLKFEKSFFAYPFEKENWLVKVGEVQSEIMSGYTM